MQYLKKSLFAVVVLAFVIIAWGMVNNKLGSGMVSSAKKFVNSLSEVQKKKGVYPFEATSRLIWEFLPVADVRRPGISLKELSKEQQQLVHDLLKTSLSEEGYFKAEQIMNLETVLKMLENDTKGRRDPEQYHIAIYGDPEEEGVWAWKFEGHHLSFNFVLVDGKISDTPTFLGSNPAEVREGPKKGLRVLKDEEDLAMKLVNSLDEKQKAKVIFKIEAFYEIVTAKATEVGPLEDEGILASDLNAEQRELLYQLIEEYIAVMPEALAKQRREKLEKAGKEKIRFGWAGSTTMGNAHYYRIQGPSFLVEFDNTQNQANHIHTVWRDFKGDFGRDILKEHYKSAAHHQH